MSIRSAALACFGDNRGSQQTLTGGTHNRTATPIRYVNERTKARGGCAGGAHFSLIWAARSSRRSIAVSLLLKGSDSGSAIAHSSVTSYSTAGYTSDLKVAQVCAAPAWDDPPAALMLPGARARQSSRS